MSAGSGVERTPYRMIHPGPVAERRVRWAASRLTERRSRVDGGGRSLLDVIAGLAAELGVSSGTGRITGCTLTAARFTTGGPARDGKAANYTYIRDLGSAHLPWGTFSFGQTPDGAPFVHCHAMVEADGIASPAGGHLFPSDCRAAGELAVAMLGIPDIDLVQRHDPETLHSVFEIGACRSARAPEAVFVRVRPNEDLTIALEQACTTLGIADAKVGPSLGSLNAPVLGAGAQDRIALGSVGMEAVAIEGSIAGGGATLSATLVDETGTPHAGPLVRGLAPVCVTAELLVVPR